MKKILFLVVLCIYFSNIYSQTTKSESSISKFIPKEMWDEKEKRDKLIISKYGKDYGQKIIYG